MTPSANVRTSCLIVNVISAITAWLGAALVYFEKFGVVPVFLVGISAAFFALRACSRAVSEDPGLTEPEKEKIRSWLRGFGPAGAFQLLLYIYFPSSKLAGH